MCLLLMTCWIMSTGVRNYGLVQEIDIVIIGVGGTNHRVILCEDVKITATLVKKGSGEIVLERFKYLSPYVLILGNIDVIGPIEDAPMPKDTSDVVHMDIGAILHLSASSDGHDSDPASGSQGHILCRKGLLCLGLKVHVSKEYLYPTTLISALVFSVVAL
ncbi:unnamed protein product [Sphagnum troendelagicum]|uniref:Uncharacterized protein n=1 Tax=Sphagnum troendelagicum TaxID=128251 RepID=A0ABP0UGY2_9BRYO